MEFRKAILKLVAGLTVLAILGGCTGNGIPEDMQGTGEDTNVPTGRYMEEEMPLPDGLGVLISLAQAQDGTLVLVGNTERNQYHGPWHVWHSTNGGQTWQEQDYPWLSQLDGEALNYANIGNQGGLYLHYLENYQELLRLYREEVPEEELDYNYITAYGDGELTVLDHPNPADESGAGAVGLRQAENGDLIYNCFFSLLQVDGETGRTKYSYEIDSGYYNLDGAYSVFENQLAMYNGDDQVYLYNLENGERISSTQISSRSDREKVIAVDPENQALYFADPSGLYRTAIGGSASERLVDGDLTSLGTPSLGLRNLFYREDGSFLVLVSQENDGPKLLRFYYDSQVPTVPTSSLKIYALEDNKTIRQAMSVYQKHNPDVRVEFIVGLEEESGITSADALRILSTELLADSGPDILVLDGMPMDSYIQKQVLLDLSGLIDEKIKTGELLENVAGSLRGERGLYGVPARFLPVYLQADNAASIQNLGDLADWVEDGSNGKIAHTDPETLLRQMYPIYAGDWFGVSGELNEEKMIKSLTDLKRMIDVGGFVNKQYDYMNFEDLDITFGALMWASDYVGLNWGIVDSFTNLSTVFSAEEKRGSGDTLLFSSHTGGIFIPGTILGINAAANNTQQALEFVEIALSEEVLSYSFEDGFAVNRAALRESAKNPYNENNEMYMSIWLGNDDTTDAEAELRIAWIDEQSIEQVLGDLESLTVCVPDNRIVMEMIVDEVTMGLTGSKSLERAVNDFAQKYELYRAEQR